MLTPPIYTSLNIFEKISLVNTSSICFAICFDSIGVPTVVDAATIVNDTMENFIRALESSDSLKGVGEVLRSYNAGEKYEFVKELISPHLNGMFVTPKDVDEMVHHISHTLSEAINMLFSAGSGRSEA